MGQGISEVLTFAVGVAISPVPIIAVILMLFSTRARSNSLAFLFGWVAGLSAAFWIVYVVASVANVSTSSGASKGTSVLRLVLGVLLLAAALRNWRKRPGPGEEPVMPKWMGAIDDFTSLQVVRPGGPAVGGQPEEPRPHRGRCDRGRAALALDGRRCRIADRLRGRREPDHRRPRPVLPGGRGPRQDRA